MLCYFMLSYRRAKASAYAAGVINMMVGDAQRVADCGQSCIAGIQYVPYNMCSSSYVQQAGLA